MTITVRDICYGCGHLWDQHEAGHYGRGQAWDGAKWFNTVNDCKCCVRMAARVKELNSGINSG